MIGASQSKPTPITLQIVTEVFNWFLPSQLGQELVVRGYAFTVWKLQPPVSSRNHWVGFFGVYPEFLNGFGKALGGDRTLLGKLV